MRDLPRIGFRATALLALAALVAACGGTAPTSPPFIPDDPTVAPETVAPETFAPETDTPEDPESPAPEGSLSPEDQAKVEELIGDADGAAAISNQFWVDHWSEFFTGEYVGPNVYGGYVGSENPECGGTYEDASGNAYYCAPDDYIAWDWGLFLGHYADADIGDAFVYMVISHEWGHAIQARLDQALISLSAELQADCLAGAILTGASNDGTVTMEPGDRGEIFTSLVEVADEVEWGNSQDHGSADQRIEAYQQGEANGVGACLPTQ